MQYLPDILLVDPLIRCFLFPGLAAIEYLPHAKEGYIFCVTTGMKVRFAGSKSNMWVGQAELEANVLL